jgi:hypothetical protein
MHDRWYFAYGSNLLVEQKELRTGAIRKSLRCRLPAHRFAFNKRAASGDVYANVIPDESATVWGVAYLCDKPLSLHSTGARASLVATIGRRMWRS